MITTQKNANISHQIAKKFLAYSTRHPKYLTWATQSMSDKIEQSADKIISLLSTASTKDYIGENVSQLEHALQCAHFGAKASAGNKNFVLACLLHDIGHFCEPEPDSLMGHYGVANHESIGANFLKSIGFGDSVVELVASHVAAKRFLVSTSNKYLAQLSSASLATLNFQGGVMSNSDIERFKKNPLYKQMIKLRRCDEMAKENDLKVAPLEYYRPIIIDHLTANNCA